MPTFVLSVLLLSDKLGRRCNLRPEHRGQPMRCQRARPLGVLTKLPSFIIKTTMQEHRYNSHPSSALWNKNKRRNVDIKHVMRDFGRWRQDIQRMFMDRQQIKRLSLLPLHPSCTLPLAVRRQAGQILLRRPNWFNLMSTASDKFSVLYTHAAN